MAATSLAVIWLKHTWRMDEVNDRSPAVIGTNPHANAGASQLDDVRKSSRVRGPLLGLPILLKDDIATERLEWVGSHSSMALANVQSWHFLIDK